MSRLTCRLSGVAYVVNSDTSGRARTTRHSTVRAESARRRSLARPFDLDGRPRRARTLWLFTEGADQVPRTGLDVDLSVVAEQDDHGLPLRQDRDTSRRRTGPDRGGSAGPARSPPRPERSAPPSSARSRVPAGADRRLEPSRLECRDHRWRAGPALWFPRARGPPGAPFCGRARTTMAKAADISVRSGRSTTTEGVANGLGSDRRGERAAERVHPCPWGISVCELRGAAPMKPREPARVGRVLAGEVPTRPPGAPVGATVC
jgi:hypothetical protein